MPFSIFQTLMKKTKNESSVEIQMTKVLTSMSERMNPATAGFNISGLVDLIKPLLIKGFNALAYKKTVVRRQYQEHEK